MKKLVGIEASCCVTAITISGTQDQIKMMLSSHPTSRACKTFQTIPKGGQNVANIIRDVGIHGPGPAFCYSFANQDDRSFRHFKDIRGSEEECQIVVQETLRILFGLQVETNHYEERNPIFD